MKSPNWQEARAFVDRIAGRADPEMTFQVFDDKTERYELASWKHGKLTDPAIRKFLTSKADQGCGIYVVVSACDGKGRRRSNVTHARAVFIDLDGQPLPDKWEAEPDIINETSPGKFHAFWLVQDVTDLNAFSDCQARLAAYYDADPRVFDPPRVVRLPGFYHQKKDPWRSRTIRICDASAAEQFERRDMAAIAEVHECVYDPPAERAEGGRSDEPADGWDNPLDVDRATAYLQSVKLPKIGDRNNSGYRVAAKLNDFGISPELSFDLMMDHWNARLDAPLKDHEIRHVIKSASRYKASAPGSESGADDFDEEISAEELDAIAENATSKKDFDFEEQPEFEEASDKPASSSEFDFETKAATQPVKDRPKTIRRETKGVSWSWGSEVKAEALSWLWPFRIPRGKLTLIAGFPDQGKSQIMLNIAAAVTNGSEWPNAEGTAPQGVAIILSSEDDEADTLIPRLAAAGANLENIIIVRSMVKFVDEGTKRKRVLNIEDDLNALTRIMKEVHEKGKRVRMIGMDPINAYLGGSKKADSHKNSDMRALLTPISEWAAMLRIAVIAITHFNKGGNAHTLYRVTDSGAITAAARAVYFALKVHNDDAKAGDEPERVFVSGKHNLAPDSVKGLTYRIDAKDVSDKTGVPNQVMPFVEFGGETSITAEEAMDGMKKPAGRPSQGREEAKEWLREHVEASGGTVEIKATIAAAKALGINEATIKRAREDLGYGFRRSAEFQGKGEWYIPDAPAVEFDDERDADHAEPDFG